MKRGLTPTLVIAGILLGLVIADLGRVSWLFNQTQVLGMVAGAVIGALFAQLIGLSRRIRTLEAQRESAEPSPKSEERRVPTRPAASAATPGPAEAPASAEHWDRPEFRSADSETRSRRPATSSSGGFASRVKGWFTHGNVPVKIGVLVLFVGVAALLRYATEQGWLNTPIEVRLMGIAGVAIAGLVFAWRQRDQRRIFSLALQGGAIGVLALTVFAAFRFYDVLPAVAAFALLVVLTGATGILSVVQNSLALAVLALVAGFTAPIMVATGSGNHVALFGWYALLNVGIFGVARYRTWPLLNRLGFAFTFIIGTVWGVLSYSPADYPTTQPFLLLFFALYLLIPIFNALKPGHGSKERLDAVLVFGLPLFAFPLQAGLLDGERMPIAFSAVLLALIYLVSAFWLIRRLKIVALGRSHAVLAVGFATLAIPFAFSGSTIAIIWALEGAALVWFGLYQNHRFGRLTGLALQVLAALVWVLTLSPGDGMSILNDFYLSALALTIAFSISAWRYADHGASGRLVNALALVAVTVWSLAGMIEIETHARAALRPDVLLILAAMTALISAIAHQYRSWPVTGLVPAVALASGVLVTFLQIEAHDWPLGGWGAPAWALFLIAAFVAQGHIQAARPLWRGLAALAVHAAIVTMISASLVHLTHEVWQLAAGWSWLAAAMPLLALAAWLQAGYRAPLTLDALPEPQLEWIHIGAMALMVAGLATSLVAAGSAVPLPWIPVLNPLEVGQLLALVLITRMAIRRTRGRFPAWIAATGFVVVTVMVLRAVHHLAGVEWSAEALLNSNVSQAALSVAWAVMAVVAWVGGSRHGNRLLWLTGAILLGLVLAKLILIDRSFLSTVAGIVSFLAFGVLSILIGYLAPAPPRVSSSDGERVS